MANTYCETSSLLRVPAEKLAHAKMLLARLVAELEASDEGLGLQVSVVEDGVWFRADESLSVENMESIARQLVEELVLPDPFVASWAYVCSKPHIDAFGGGAFALELGKPTVWIDAATDVVKLLEKGNNVTSEDG